MKKDNEIFLNIVWRRIKYEIKYIFNIIYLYEYYSFI